ncbi:MAG: hypothetical protein IPL33_06035 [Sphingobacteriales bacterium]|nr:hypothetical protein [Sphingobacteriales bacterium]
MDYYICSMIEGDNHLELFVDELVYLDEVHKGRFNSTVDGPLDSLRSGDVIIESSGFYGFEVVEERCIDSQNYSPRCVSWAVEMGNQIPSALMACCSCTKLKQPQAPRFARFDLAQLSLEKANMPCFPPNPTSAGRQGNNTSKDIAIFDLIGRIVKAQGKCRASRCRWSAPRHVYGIGSKSPIISHQKIERHRTARRQQQESIAYM